MKHLFLSGLLIGSVVLGAGCGRTPETPRTPTELGRATSTNSAQPSTNTGATDSLCSHPYFPAKNGYRVDYKSSANNRISNYNLSVSDVTRDQATMTFSMGTTTIAHRIGCTDNGIVEHQFLNLSSLLTGGIVEIESRGATGTMLIRDLRPGARWSQGFDFITTSYAGELRMVMGSNVTIDREAISEESVTVQAGTFTAMKVKSKINMRNKLMMDAGTNDLPLITLEQNEWWVRGKGLVKSQSTGSGSPINMNWTSEATAIVTP